jgi:hypothetical protein
MLRTRETVVNNWCEMFGHVGKLPLYPYALWMRSCVGGREHKLHTPGLVEVAGACLWVMQQQRVDVAGGRVAVGTICIREDSFMWDRHYCIISLAWNVIRSYEVPASSCGSRFGQVSAGALNQMHRWLRQEFALR